MIDKVDGRVVIMMPVQLKTEEESSLYFPFRKYWRVLCVVNNSTLRKNCSVDLRRLETKMQNGNN